MPTNTMPESVEINEFNFKHRVTGAAVLLFLGAAVLPWLLGPPSQASKANPHADLVQASDVSTEVRGADLLAGGAVDIEETVYVSKITPIDGKNKANLREVAQQAATTSVATIPNKKDSSDIDNITTKEELASRKSAEGVKKKRDLAAIQESKKAQSAADKRRKDKQQQDAAESALQAKLAKEKVVQENTVDVGWIVQVGLFIEKDRAIAFISELKTKGFNASSNVVDTNRGKNTGTRVWLGPFARKASAANELERLKAKAGKDGFIRDYP